MWRRQPGAAATDGYGSRVSKRVNVTLDDEHAAMLSRLAERARVSDGTLARSLLAGAIEGSDPDPRTVTEILEAVPGLLERVEAAEAEVDRGDYIDLTELRTTRR